MPDTVPDEPLFAEPSGAESVAGRPVGRDSRPAGERNGPEPTPGTGEAVQARFVKLPLHVLARSDLSPAAKLVYAAIADRIGRNSEAWPGVRRLANDCGLSPATVVHATHRLEAVGLLTVDHVSGNPGGRTNRYRLRERSDIRTCQNPNVPESEHRTYQKTNTERSDFGTEPDPCNQTHVTRHKGKRRSAAPPQPDRLAHDAVKLWCDTYTESRGDKPDPPDGRAVGMLGRLVHGTAGGSLDVLRDRLRVAAGLDGRTPPWPFDRPGELTIANVAKHWDKLGDALKAGSDERGGRGGRGPTRAVPRLEERITVRDYPGTE